MSDMDPDEWYDEEDDDVDVDVNDVPSDGEDDGMDEFDFDDDDNDDVNGEVNEQVEQEEDDDDEAAIVQDDSVGGNRETMTTLTNLMRQAAQPQPQPDGTLYIPHSFFRQLFTSGLLPRDIYRRIQGGADDDDLDDLDEDEEGEEWGEDDDDDEDEIGFGFFGGDGRRDRAGTTGRNGRSKGWDWFELEREGKEVGRKLSRGGEFGRVGFPLPGQVRVGLRGGVGVGVGGNKGDAMGEEERHEEETEVDEDMIGSRESPTGSSGSSTSTFAPHLSMSPTTSTTTTSQGEIKFNPRRRRRRRQRSSASKPDLIKTSSIGAEAGAGGDGDGGRPATRRLSGSSLTSRLSRMEENDGRIRGIKVKVQARGAWGKGMKGFGKEVGRGVWGASGREEWGRKCVPNTNGTIVATYDSYPYIGQHSHDYSFFYTATKDFQLHLYSTQDAPRSRLAERAAEAATNPTTTGARLIRSTRSSVFTRRYGLEEVGEDHSMRKIKTVQGVEGQWTVTDANLSRDNQWMIYSSINPRVHLLRTAEHEHEHTLLDFSENRVRGYYSREFGIWSVRFSADQKEIVAGAGSGQIMIYDIEAKRRILNIEAHNADVNGVCFADENSTNVIVSASDDGYLKVWDRRSIASSVPSGVLVGATEGLTYVDTKGDGRYILANGKDQAMRLWDLRKMRTWGEIQDTPDAKIEYGLRTWDYRHGFYRKPRYEAHPLDCSVMTYRGHRVLQTLIRCHFSPSESTGGQYVYSGGSNGVIWIYHLDGRIVQVLDRTKAQPLVNPTTGEYNDPSAPSPVVNEYDPDPKGAGLCTVRDVSWNGNEPSMISTAWDGHSEGNIAVHCWKGLGKGGLNRLEDWVEVALANGAEGVGDDGRA